MNTFYEHHQHSIKMTCRCFDRILLNGLIQPFQQPERVIGFFNTTARVSGSLASCSARSVSSFMAGSKTAR